MAFKHNQEQRDHAARLAASCKALRTALEHGFSGSVPKDVLAREIDLWKTIEEFWDDYQRLLTKFAVSNAGKGVAEKALRRLQCGTRRVNVN